MLYKKKDDRSRYIYSEVIKCHVGGNTIVNLPTRAGYCSSIFMQVNKHEIKKISIETNEWKRPHIIDGIELFVLEPVGENIYNIIDARLALSFFTTRITITIHDSEYIKNASLKYDDAPLSKIVNITKLINNSTTGKKIYDMMPYNTTKVILYYLIEEPIIHPIKYDTMTFKININGTSASFFHDFDYPIQHIHFYFLESDITKNPRNILNYVFVNKEKYSKDLCLLNTSIFFTGKFKLGVYTIAFKHIYLRVIDENIDTSVRIEFNMKKHFTGIAYCHVIC